MKILALALAVLALVGMGACEHRITEYPPQPRMTAPIDRSITTVILTVHWHDSVDQIDKACGPRKHTAYGCRSAFARIAPGTVACTIEMIPPDDFNDVPKLAIGGHEIALHCYDALHE